MSTAGNVEVRTALCCLWDTHWMSLIVFICVTILMCLLLSDPAELVVQSCSAFCILTSYFDVW